MISTVVFSMGRQCRPRGPRHLIGLGRGVPPPHVTAVVSAALSQGPSAHLPARTQGSPCLRDGAPAAIKPLRSQDPPRGKALGHTGSRSPGGRHQPGPAPAAPRCARHPGCRHASGSVLSPLCRHRGRALLPCPPFHTRPTAGRGDGQTREKRTPSGRAFNCAAGWQCLHRALPEPQPGAERRRKPHPGEHRPSVTAENSTKSLSIQKAPSVAGAVQPQVPAGTGVHGAGSCPGAGQPRTTTPQGEASFPLPPGAGAALPRPRCHLPGCFSTTTPPTSQPGLRGTRGGIHVCALSLCPSAQSQLLSSSSWKFRGSTALISRLVPGAAPLSRGQARGWQG